MPAPRDRKHIIVSVKPTAEPYRPHGRKMDIEAPTPPANRAAHGRNLKRALDSAVADAMRRRGNAGFAIPGAEPGIYVQFDSQPGTRLELSSLEAARQGIELVAVTYAKSEETVPRTIERAVVFVPDGKVKHFVARFEAYAKVGQKAKGERRYEAMIDPVAALRLATLRALWTDTSDSYPATGEIIWWEVWLRRHDGTELERLLQFAGLKGLTVSGRRLQFEDRIIILVRATADDLSSSIDVLNDLAEVGRAKETATFFAEMGAEEQGEWAKDLLARTGTAADDAPSVCLLDTGVTRGHPLLADSLASADCHTCDPAWGAHDHHGHGTEMAGLALYGDLTPVLASSAQVQLRHRLESVKILPPGDASAPDLYGSITAEATSRVEIEAPYRQRCFSMAVTTDSRDRGQPTSWSAAVDALAAGRAFDSTQQGLVYIDDPGDAHRRLFVLSAGNVDKSRMQIAHLEQSDSDTIEDPGQAWNALTIGAFTDKALVNDPRWSGWEPVAPPGDLSPWSTTSVTFEKNKWPIKPDVVFEGGNVLRSAAGTFYEACPELCVLTTSHQPTEEALVLSWATSAATAQAARMAATIGAEYPSLWPESIRGLIVHSAEWTPQMQTHLRGAPGKRGRANLVRRYGFGVPRIERALRSAKDALTLIVQDSIRPFAEGKMREMHFFALPWPTAVLQGLGETPVRLRVTLSYFIEPNPGRRGWKKRHRYASHALRFDVKGPTESLDEFRKRLNQQALDDDEERPRVGGDASEWYLGKEARDHGSIHSDSLVGTDGQPATAADIAERGVIGVFPVGGWWKEQPKRDRSEHGARYSLIVSIETPGVDTDIWTPVAQQVGVPIAIET